MLLAPSASKVQSKTTRRHQAPLKSHMIGPSFAKVSDRPIDLHSVRAFASAPAPDLYFFMNQHASKA